MKKVTKEEFEEIKELLKSNNKTKTSKLTERNIKTVIAISKSESFEEYKVRTQKAKAINPEPVPEQVEIKEEPNHDKEVKLPNTTIVIETNSEQVISVIGMIAKTLEEINVSLKTLVENDTRFIEESSKKKGWFK